MSDSADRVDDEGDADEPMTVREERLPDGRTIVFFTFGDDVV